MNMWPVVLRFGLPHLSRTASPIYHAAVATAPAESPADPAPGAPPALVNVADQPATPTPTPNNEPQDDAPALGRPVPVPIPVALSPTRRAQRARRTTRTDGPPPVYPRATAPTRPTLGLSVYTSLP
ncbi:hypothetical protein FRC12_014397 [Ceratobasidium sp. 428]|nr:hypothetical protein FRC12_014397 [Ceratobasidium sp. 428]